MRDDWYGHRDLFTGEPVGDRDEWIEWDHIFADVLQTIEDYTDQYGLLAWEREDEAVEIEAEKRIHKFEAARDRATSGKNYKAAPGEYFIPKVFSRRRDEDGNEVIQTYREWVMKEAEKHSKEG